MVAEDKKHHIFGAMNEKQMLEEYKLACKLAEKDLSVDLFMSYLMDKLDLQREYLTYEEFSAIDFSVLGYPRFMIDYLSKLSGHSYEPLLFRRLKGFNKP